MIYGRLKDMQNLKSVNPLLERGMEFLRTADLEALTVEDGIVELEGQDLFVLVQEYDTKTVQEKRFEAHDIYGEIQLVVKGEETMGITWREGLVTDEDLLEAKDNIYYKNPEKCNLLPYHQGDLAVFFPEDVHLTGIQLDQKSCPVKKILVKFTNLYQERKE